jgi:hypothetical protein
MSECGYFRIDAGKGLRRLPTLADALLSKQAGGYLWLVRRSVVPLAVRSALEGVPPPP